MDTRTLIKVTWLDSQDHPDKWVDEADANSFGDSDCTIESVGFMVSRTGKYITLAGDWDATDKDYGRVTKVPVAWVVSIEELTLVPQISTPER